MSWDVSWSSNITCSATAIRLNTRGRASFRQDLSSCTNAATGQSTWRRFLDRKLDLPRGLSPVVFTFDDASPEQFSYIEKDGKLEIDPKSALESGWISGRRTRIGTTRLCFCLLSGAAAGRSFSAQECSNQKTAWRFTKVKWLVDNGFELCNHTLWHAQLSKFPDAFVQEQIARLDLAVDSAVPGYKIRSMALPQGLWPKNRALASKGSWKDPKSGKTITYNYEAVFEVAGGPSRSPHDPAFNPLSTNRIQVIGNAIQTTMDRLEKSGNAYISDGNRPRSAAIRSCDCDDCPVSKTIARAVRELGCSVGEESGSDYARSGGAPNYAPSLHSVAGLLVAR